MKIRRHFAPVQSRFWVEPATQMSWQRYASAEEVEYPEHVHSEFNLVVCLEGRVEVRQFGQIAIVEPGELLLGNAAVPHRSIYHPDDRECRAVSLTISAHLLNEAAELERPLAIPAKGHQPVYLGTLVSPKIHEIAKAVYDELQGTGRPDQDRMEQSGRLLVGEMLNGWPRFGRAEQTTGGRVLCLPRWQFVRTHEWMLVSPKDEFEVTEVARRLGICVSRFHHLFRVSAGLPPAQYFRNLILRQASERLVRTEDQIKEISYDLGFRTPSHFCSLFRKHYGISPLECRASAVRNLDPVTPVTKPSFLSA